MANASSYVPMSVRAKTDIELTKKIQLIQAKQGGKIAILNICQDVKSGEWVCWFYPVKNLGGGMF